MESFDLVIAGGTVATASDVVKCDIGVRGGKIAALAERVPGGAQRIDAGGRLVLPGGVDSHVHFAQPSGPGVRMADDFITGTRSALAGGNTTVLPFAYQHRGQGLREAVKAYHLQADGKALIDYAFHLIISDPTEQVLGQELPALIKDGYTSFKVYMTYDDLKLSDHQMLDVLDLARREGAMTMIHAENCDCIGWLTARDAIAGRTAPRYHCTSRPMAVEREATHRAVTLAELIDVPILIVHVSGREAMEQIRAAQARGLQVYGETCPQYLVLSEEDFEQPSMLGAKCVCSPPPRDKANQASIMAGIAQGVFQVFSSDHCPFNYEGPDGKLVGGHNTPYWKIPNGAPGVETRLPILFSEGVGKGQITLEQFVAVTATNPAKIYGLHPRKGTIAVGADADFAIWDAERKVTVTNSMLHHACDYTPYEGKTFTGWPITTISRGDVVWADGQITARAGRGEFLRCALPEPAKPKVRYDA
jgi:dihydropyrimidinase